MGVVVPQASVFAVANGRQQMLQTLLNIYESSVPLAAVRTSNKWTTSRLIDVVDLWTLAGTRDARRGPLGTTLDVIVMLVAMPMVSQYLSKYDLRLMAQTPWQVQVVKKSEPHHPLAEEEEHNANT